MEKTDRHLSRRKLLVVMGSGAIAVGVVVAAPYKALIRARARNLIRNVPLAQRLLSLANAGYDEWREQVGATFGVAGTSGMRLIGVEALNSGGQRPAGLRDRAFAAHFTVLGGGTMAGDLIYLARHPDYGPLAIFLSASTDPTAPSRMIAVFN